MISANKKQSTKVDITIENNKVLQETSFNYMYLGVTLSSDLTWHNHIDNMITKINQRLGVLRRVKEFLDLNTRCVLYTSLVLPLFDYGDTIWGFSLSLFICFPFQTYRGEMSVYICFVITLIELFMNYDHEMRCVSFRCRCFYIVYV